MEEYRKIDTLLNGINYDNYSVSNLANIRNDTTGRILKHLINIKEINDDEFELYEVNLCHNKKYKQFIVLELVGLVFDVEDGKIEYIKSKDKWNVSFKAEN